MAFNARSTSWLRQCELSVQWIGNYTRRKRRHLLLLFLLFLCLVGRLLACLSGLLVVCRCFNNFVCLFCSLCGWLLTCGSLCSSLASLPTHSWTDSKGWVKGQLQALPSHPLSPKPPTSCHTPTTTSRPNHPLRVIHPQQHHAQITHFMSHTHNNITPQTTHFMSHTHHTTPRSQHHPPVKGIAPRPPPPTKV